MSIKSHYKIIISIIIVILLLSSLIVYFNLPKTEYYNDVSHETLKYYGNHHGVNYTGKYELTSFASTGNKDYYLNSTLTDICIYPANEPNPAIHGIVFCLYVNESSNNKIAVSMSNNTEIHVSQSLINNTHVYCVTGFLYYSNVNFTVNVNSGKLYNVFYINAVKESAIYGIINSNGVTNTSITSKYFYIQDVNNSKIYSVEINDGRYYFFARPYTYYKFYSSNNGNITLLHFYNSSSQYVKEIETGGPGSSSDTSIPASEIV